MRLPRAPALALFAALFVFASARAAGQDRARSPDDPVFFKVAPNGAHVVVDPATVPQLQRRVTASATGQTRDQALQIIMRSADLGFSASQPVLSRGTIPLDVKGSTVAAALRDILRGTGLDVLLTSPNTLSIIPKAASSRTSWVQEINGRVTAEGGLPINGANIRVTPPFSKDTLRAITNAAGRWVIRVPNGKGEYIVEVGALGWTPYKGRITGAPSDTAFTVDAVLKPTQAPMQTLVSTGLRVSPARLDDLQPDGLSLPIAMLNGALAPDQMSDVTAMAATVPGVSITPDGDITALGLEGTNNAVSLNGLPFSGTSIPREMPMRARFVNSAYDPTVGGFSGMGILLQLSPGSRLPSRRAHLTFDAPQLQVTPAAGRPLGAQFTRVQASYGASGELVANSWNYNTALQIARRTSTAPSLFTANGVALERLGLASDSAARLLELMDAAGIPVNGGSVPTGTTATTISTAFRLDRARATEVCCGLVRDTKPRLGFLGTAMLMQSEPVAAFGAATPSHAAQQSGAQVTLQGNYSRFFGDGAFYLNESRSSFSYSTGTRDPYVELPEGRVSVMSDFADGTHALAAPLFGGYAGTVSSSRTWTWAAASDLSFSPARAPNHHIKLAFESLLDGYTAKTQSNVLGTFTYNALTDFEHNNPASYSRTLRTPNRAGGEWSGALGIADSWAASRSFTLTFGPRLETNIFTARPLYNPAIDSLFGTRTDRAPNAFHVSPRVGFRWMYRDPRDDGALPGGVSTGGLGQVAAPPRGMLSGGVGELRSRLPAALLAGPMGSTGIAGTTTEQLFCVGSAVPAPDWRSYTTDPSTIPANCADGTLPLFADSAPTVRLFDQSFDAARTWRANLMWASGQRALYYSVNAVYSLNLSQPGSMDLNFGGEPRFVLANEKNRPVYVSAGSIVPSTGLVPASAARRVSSLGRVLEQRSDLSSRTKQVQVSVTPYLPAALSKWALTGTYTFTDTRATARGFDATTGGDPRVADWAPGPAPRHSLTIQGGYSFGKLNSVALTTFTTVSSGFAYTPLAGGDVNGDGVWNDRAYVFDPSVSPSSSIAGGMTALLTSAPPGARACLSRQLGQIAGRNSCRQPFTVDFNARLDWQHEFGETGRGFKVALNFQNPIAGIDQMLHGSQNVRGWGARTLPDVTLYQVRSFDPTTRRFQYEINPRFGSPRPEAIGTLNPFRITLDVQLDVGRPDGDALVRRYLRPLRNERIRPPVDSVHARIAADGVAGMDPYDWILANADSLVLTTPQESELRMASVSRGMRVDSIRIALARNLVGLPEHYEAAYARRLIEDAAAAMADIRRDAIFIRETLTPSQIRLMPLEELRRMPGLMQAAGTEG